MMQRPWWVLPLALALVWLASLTPTLPRASHALLDAQLRLAWPATLRGDVAVVDIDAASVRALQLQLGKWPYRRDTYAALADFLFALGARVVVLDVPLPTTRDADDELARLLRRQGGVVLTARALGDAQGGDPDALRTQGHEWPAQWPRAAWPAAIAPDAGLLATRASLGLVAPIDGSDGRLHRWPLLHEVNGRGVPALPLAALQALQPDAPLRYGDGRVHLGARSWPLDAQGRVVTTLPAGEPVLGFMRVTAAAQGITDDAGLRSRVRGRIVFVGSSLGGDARGALPATAVWAAATRALAAGQALGPQSRALNALLLAVAVLPLLTLRWRRRSDLRTEALLAAAAMLTVLMASMLALQAFGLPSQPLSALLIPAAGWVLLWAAQPRADASVRPGRDEPARSGAPT
jgi:CHASE2 domain-containing sensor protein